MEPPPNKVWKRRLTKAAGAFAAWVALAGLGFWHAGRSTHGPGAIRDRMHIGGSIADGRNPTKDRVGLFLHGLGCQAGDARSCTNRGEQRTRR